MHSEDFSMIEIKGYNYCPIHSSEIDYELVRIKKPLCIKMHNGCGNCPCCVYITTVEVEDKNGKKRSEKYEQRF